MLDFNLCVNTLNGDRELKENGKPGTRAYLGGIRAQDMCGWSGLFVSGTLLIYLFMQATAYLL